ncbi:hypothetical protein [Mediterraneibacter catenae]|uniref:hypothetical protein n=1 Tax=Mediterraneibacter catenae TaxID=2594882 RepID=UPI00192D6B1C|nr:hypothetical protein [Mediterraneibacter catenae]
MFKFENGAILALSEEEEAAVMAAYEDYQKQKNKQPMTQNEVFMLLTQQLTAQHSTAQHSTAQHSTAQHSTAQHSTAQHSTAQHSTAQHSTAHRIVT